MQCRALLDFHGGFNIIVVYWLRRRAILHGRRSHALHRLPRRLAAAHNGRVIVHELFTVPHWQVPEPIAHPVHELAISRAYGAAYSETNTPPNSSSNLQADCETYPNTNIPSDSSSVYQALPEANGASRSSADKGA
jgi:hypothetical protein